MQHHFIISAGIAFFLVLVTNSCQTASKKTEISITNTSSFELTDKAVSIQRKQITQEPGIDAYPLLTSADGDTIPSQLNDLDGDNIWDELFFVVNLSPKASELFSLRWINTELPYAVRTSVRFGKRSAVDLPVEPALSETLYAGDLPKSIGFQRYQTDGPSWENDKIGFRHYLDGRNAKDLFGKTTIAMSPENVGINARGAVEDNYHVMADWGRDILSVGNSVGLGGFGLMAGEQLLRLGVTVDDAVNNVEKTVFKIVSEGPLKSVLGYRFENWQPVEGRTYTVNETSTIWPGMYGFQNKVTFSGLHGDEKMITGLVNSNNQNPLHIIEVNDQWLVLFTHDMQTYERQWWLGMALILPRDRYLGYIDAPKEGSLSNTFLAKLQVENDMPVTYYVAAGWELSDDRFKDADFFRSYIEDLVQQLSTHIQVTIR